MKEAQRGQDLAQVFQVSGLPAETVAAYLHAMRHYRETWGGPLPAYPHAIYCYLTHYAGKMAVSTLRIRLAALSRWHWSQGFSDPTKDAAVKEVMKVITKLFPPRQRSDQLVTINHLCAVCDRLEREKVEAIAANDRPGLLRVHRDLALFLIVFWTGAAIRHCELSRIMIERTVVLQGTELRFFLSPVSSGRRCRWGGLALPALLRYCPVEAVQRWLEVSGLSDGPLFRKVDRWGNISTSAITRNSIGGVLNRAVKDFLETCGTVGEQSFCTGFNSWACSMDWDLRALMDDVGFASEVSTRPSYRQSFGSLAVNAKEREPEVLVEGRCIGPERIDDY